MEMARFGTMMRFLLSVGILFQGCDSDVKCRDDKGNEVDWYILYKLPHINDDGLSYLYMDESTDGWKVSKEAINSTTGTLANTLKPLLDFYNRKTEGFGYMLYSDQPPEPYVAPPSFGHSKGIVLLDRQTGVWLSHSTPKFPTYRRKDFWPSSGNANAQTFMCVTFSYDQFKEIGLQLKYIHAYSYDSEIPTTFHSELQCVAQRSCYPKTEPWFRVNSLTSMTGHTFSSFAKYTRFGDDLYSGLNVNYLKENLYVKSWGKMHRPLPSNCSTSIPHHVYNVKEVKLLNGNPFSDTVDHSKWCVTPNGSWTCIADMNREVSQMKRGGGAICTDNNAVLKAFTAIITKYDPCNKGKRAPPKPKHQLKFPATVRRAGKSANRSKHKKIISTKIKRGPRTGLFKLPPASHVFCWGTLGPGTHVGHTAVARAMDAYQSPNIDRWLTGGLVFQGLPWFLFGWSVSSGIHMSAGTQGLPAEHGIVARW